MSGVKMGGNGTEQGVCKFRSMFSQSGNGLCVNYLHAIAD